MTIYCVYFTFYKGSRLPPFYIGSSSIDKINSGYRGSVSSKKYKTIWLRELETRPDLFKTHIVSTHKTRKDALIKEKILHEKLNVVRSPLYINESIATVNGMFGRDVSNKLNPMYNNGHKVSGNLNGRFNDKRTTARDNTGSTFSVSVDDPRWKTGEIRGVGTNAKKANESKSKNPNLKKYSRVMIKTPKGELITLEWFEYANYIKQNKLGDILSFGSRKGFVVIEKVLNPNCKMKQPIKRSQKSSM